MRVDWLDAPTQSEADVDGLALGAAHAMKRAAVCVVAGRRLAERRKKLILFIGEIRAGGVVSMVRVVLLVMWGGLQVFCGGSEILCCTEEAHATEALASRWLIGQGRLHHLVPGGRGGASCSGGGLVASCRHHPTTPNGSPVSPFLRRYSAVLALPIYQSIFPNHEKFFSAWLRFRSKLIGSNVIQL